MVSPFSDLEFTRLELRVHFCYHTQKTGNTWKTMNYSDKYSELRELAGKAGLSVTGLCKAAGVSRGTVARWRRGETMPSFRIWAKLQQAAAKGKS
jgi:DNA-binding XRE family transcriptional regulator